MLLVSSNNDLTDYSLLEFLSMGNIDSDSILNLLGDYRYLRLGYYVSLHAELLNLPAIPTIKNILDAFKILFSLLGARKVRISIILYLKNRKNTRSIEEKTSLSEHEYEHEYEQVFKYRMKGWKERKRKQQRRIYKTKKINQNIKIKKKKAGEILKASQIEFKGWEEL